MGKPGPKDSEFEISDVYFRSSTLMQDQESGISGACNVEDHRRPPSVPGIWQEN